MVALPENLYNAVQVRQLDRYAIDNFKVPGYRLMQSAGQAIFNCLSDLPFSLDRPLRVLIFCGSGNNAGDGYIVARLAYQAGMQVQLIAVKPLDMLQGDSAKAATEWLQCSGEVFLVDDIDLNSYEFNDFDCVVDALLGTGLNGPVTGSYQYLIDMINNISAYKIAVDIASGLNADTGVLMGVAVKADLTVSFVGMKQGFFLEQGPEYSGQIIFDDLNVPREVYDFMQPSMKRISSDVLQVHLKPRPKTAHKGMYGHVLIIGGDQGMSGAVRMAGSAALRVGAGLVSIATHPQHATVVNAIQPELMCYGIDKPANLKPLLEQASVVVIGPGLGQSTWANGLMSAVLESSLPIIIDADALNLLAKEFYQRKNWLITPHPGEAARLLGTDTETIQLDRPKAVSELVEKYGAVSVLKGAGTLIRGLQGQLYVCDKGNPGMATAGMGDVLSGVIAGLVAQGLILDDAAIAGVWMHAEAADLVANESGMRGMVATDLLPYLQKLSNP